MSFDVNGNFVRPGDFTADQSNGQNFTSVRIDQELDEVASGLTELATRIENVATTGASTIAISNVSGLQSALDGKQSALGYTPVNIAQVGISVAPINTTTGKIDSTYLPSSGSSVFTGITSFNGRTDANAALTSADVTTALGFTPAQNAHGHAIADVAGLQTALDGKQSLLGYTPANTVHTHVMADITDLAAALDDKITISLASTSNETSFPVGQFLIVQCGSITKNGSVPIYTGVAGTDSYTTTSSGSVLDGTWRVRGPLGTTPSFALFQRVA